jgi:hypothetical protein
VVREGIEVLEMVIVCSDFAMYCVYIRGVTAYQLNLSKFLLFQPFRSYKCQHRF